MKKLLLFASLLVTSCALAFPGPGPRPGPRPPMHHSHTWHGRDWGAFGTGVGIGILGGLFARPTPPPPVVVTAPVVTAPVVTTPVVAAPVVAAPVVVPQRVWIPGHYETSVVNGVVTKIWIPGQWVVR